MSNITREQNKNLITTVAKLVNVFKKKENVECIYLMPFKVEEGNKYFLVIVYNSTKIALAKSENVIKCYNKKIKEKLDDQKIGGKLYILADRSSNYEMRALNPSKVDKVQDLLSSRILYTKEGYGRRYHKIAHQFDRYHTMERYPEYFRIAIPEEQKKKMKSLGTSKNV